MRWCITDGIAPELLNVRLQMANFHGMGMPHPPNMPPFFGVPPNLPGMPPNYCIPAGARIPAPIPLGERPRTRGISSKRPVSGLGGTLEVAGVPVANWGGNRAGRDYSEHNRIIAGGAESVELPSRGRNRGGRGGRRGVGGMMPALWPNARNVSWAVEVDKDYDRRIGYKDPNARQHNVHNNPNVHGNPNVKNTPNVHGNPNIHGNPNVHGNPSMHGSPNIHGNPSVHGNPNIHNNPNVPNASNVHNTHNVHMMPDQGLPHHHMAYSNDNQMAQHGQGYAANLPSNTMQDPSVNHPTMPYTTPLVQQSPMNMHMVMPQSTAVHADDKTPLGQVHILAKPPEKLANQGRGRGIAATFNNVAGTVKPGQSSAIGRGFLLEKQQQSMPS